MNYIYVITSFDSLKTIIINCYNPISELDYRREILFSLKPINGLACKTFRLTDEEFNIVVNNIGNKIPQSLLPSYLEPGINEYYTLNNKMIESYIDRCIKQKKYYLKKMIEWRWYKRPKKGFRYDKVEDISILVDKLTEYDGLEKINLLPYLIDKMVGLTSEVKNYFKILFNN